MNSLGFIGFYLMAFALVARYGPSLLNIHRRNRKRFNDTLAAKVIERAKARHRKAQQESAWYFNGDEK